MSNPGIEKNLSVAVSQMTEHDLLEVVEIEEASGLSRWGWDAYYGELARPRETIMLVARPLFEEGSPARFNILGFIASRLSTDELHINNMAVRDGWRKLGVGARLLEEALAEGKRRGARRSFLEVRLSNGAAQALYYRFGFRESGKRPNYYSDPAEDAVLMTVSFA